MALTRRNNDDDEEESPDPSANWRDTHEAIERTIEELGGKVAPKLNWSAPKDATWIAATNSMECRTPNDIYLLLGWRSKEQICLVFVPDTEREFVPPTPNTAGHETSTSVAHEMKCNDSSDSSSQDS